MANVNAPYGFKAVKSPGRNQEANYYDASNSAEIFEGDLLILDSSSGYVKKATAATADFIGVAANASGAAIDSSTVSSIAVLDDPDQIFSVQGDTSAITQAVVGNLYNPTIAAPSNGLPLSASILDLSATSSSYACRVLGFDPSVGNEVGPSAKLLVKILRRSN